MTVNVERPFSRSASLTRLRQVEQEGSAIVGAGSSVGIVAKSAEAGGADLIIVYSTGRSRIMGLPTTQIGHSNPITLSMYEEISNVVDHTPIVGGIEAIDPTYRRLPRLIAAFRDTGYDGVINFPTVGNLPGSAAEGHVGKDFDREVEMVRLAHDEDMFTMAYVWNTEQARAMASVGVDVQVAHVGWTVGGMVGAGAGAMAIQEAARRVQEIVEVTAQENAESITLAHGGPFASPADCKYLYEQTDARGFVGASSIERIPIEEAIRKVVGDFKAQRPRAAE